MQVIQYSHNYYFYDLPLSCSIFPVDAVSWTCRSTQNVFSCGCSPREVTYTHGCAVCHCPYRFDVTLVTLVCMCWFDAHYLSQNVGAVPMEGVDFPIKGGDVGSSLHRTDSRTVVLRTLPLATLTHTVSTHRYTHTHTHTHTDTHTQYMKLITIITFILWIHL